MVRGWTIENNRAPKNNRNLANCRRTYPALSGVGIALFGASDNVVEHNRVFDNRGKEPSGGCGCGVRLRPGGIVLFRTPFGRIPASHNTISHNTALRNEPADILWDGRGTGNAFLGNDCGSSGPRRLCH